MDQAQNTDILKQLNRLLISRTDSIGDVILTLPLCGLIKSINPRLKIYFLGKQYTRAVVEACQSVDEFIDVDELFQKPDSKQVETIKQLKLDAVIHVFPRKRIAKLMYRAGVSFRLGASGRMYNLLYCNKIVRMSRKRSDKHEAILNLELLRGLGYQHDLQSNEIPNYYRLEPQEELPEKLKSMLSNKKFNLILHPKSKGSAREWGLENFGKLIALLPPDDFQVIISGTEAEAGLMSDWLSKLPNHIINSCGSMNLKQFISFIGAADGLIAASTGPLHIAAALEKVSLGIYPPIKPMHPGRWAPLGKKASYLVLDKSCSDCRKTQNCHCMAEIKPEAVYQKLKTIKDAHH
ncbi:MAG: glycosyltransferase family 9 protein [Bacteroidales bacterium]|nr:glycosyltransferase family 9 protein [Bacteroidales bacterium]